MQNRPAYLLGSVDNALRAALLLQHEGPLQLTEVAERIGVARSTAHRLLSMLVYRGFAEQTSNRSYAAGAVLGTGDPATASRAAVRAAALPQMHTLMARTGETVNLVVLVRSHVRFLATVESTRVLRVGDREGRVMPAWLTSGGKAILADMADDAVVAALQSDSELGEPELRRILRTLALVRRRGFAVNEQETERGVTAIGTVVRVPDTPCALSIALPSARFSRAALPELVAEMRRAGTAMERALKARAAPGS